MQNQNGDNLPVLSTRSPLRKLLLHRNRAAAIAQPVALGFRVEWRASSQCPCAGRWRWRWQWVSSGDELHRRVRGSRARDMIELAKQTAFFKNRGLLAAGALAASACVMNGAGPHVLHKQ